MSLALKRSLRQAFLDMAHDGEGREILSTWGIARFDPVEDVAYDPIRVMSSDAANARLSVHA